MKRLLLLVGFSVALLTLAGCGFYAPGVSEAVAVTQSASEAEVAALPPADTSIPTFAFDAADYSYSGPETVAEGWVNVKLTNIGAEPHHLQFIRLNDGVTLEAFKAALAEGEGPALAMGRQVGGVGALAPALSAEATLNLPAGEYAILCFIPSAADGVAHHAKGMVQGLTVRAPAATTEAPTTELTATLQDFTINMPDTIAAGLSTIRIVNNGPEPHELNFLRLEDGRTMDDLVAWLTERSGPPPFAPVGGMNGLDSGQEGFVTFDFRPGTYVAICNIPSPTNQGTPHSALGMTLPISVK